MTIAHRVTLSKVWFGYIAFCLMWPLLEHNGRYCNITWWLTQNGKHMFTQKGKHLPCIDMSYITPTTHTYTHTHAQSHTHRVTRTESHTHTHTHTHTNC